MTWQIAVIIAPFLYALANQADKFILSKIFRIDGAEVLLILSGLVAGIAMPAILFIDQSVIFVTTPALVLAGLTGLLNVAILWLYFKALEEASAPSVVIYYQLVPGFGVILGRIFLGEHLTAGQIAAVAVVAVGASLPSIHWGSSRSAKLHPRTFFSMTLASLCWAGSAVAFKGSAIESSLWASLFWEHGFLFLTSILMISISRRYRNSLFRAVSLNSRFAILLSGTNEILYIAGTFLFSFAYLNAPVAVALSANSLQSFYIFFISVFSQLIFGPLGDEATSPQSAKIFLSALVITFCGNAYLLIGQ